MIGAIKEIGEYAVEKEGKNVEEPLDILVDNPANRDTENILFIVLEKRNNGFVYKGADVEEYSRSTDKLKRYLYKKGSPNGPDVTPTSMITNLDKTFTKIKILPWFKKYDTLGLNEDTNLLVNIGNCIRENKGEILDDLKNKVCKENNVISLKINGKYVGDYPVFQKILIDESKKGFYFTSSFSGANKESKSNNQKCCVCNEKQKEVYGFVGTYKFYTVDKPGFVSGGFQQKDAWKNYPVCLNCALKLEAGKKYLQNKLNFNFYGFKYHLIPKFINKGYYENNEGIFDLMEKWQDPKFRNTEINMLTTDEKEILEFMSEQKNYLNMNFMFYDAPKGYDGSVFNILLYVEDILPSRLRKLFEVKKEVDKIDIFKECMVPVFDNKTKKKVGEKSMEFNFGIVRTFFPKISNNRTYDKYFLDIVNKIFTNKLVNYDFLLQFILQKIRDDFVNDYPTKISTLKGFMLLNYLNNLNTLKTTKNNVNKSKMEPTTTNMHEIDAFFEQFAAFFDSDAKKAIFLEGVLTQFLLNIQRLPEVSNAKPGKEPFRPKLKGLKLNEKQIKKLLPEIQNKLEEYGKNYYRTLESIISDYFVSAGNNWKLTNDEISFYFVLGMNLSNKFKSKKEEENKNDNE